MKLFVPKESNTGETRTALSPESADKLIGIGLTVCAQSGLGDLSEYPDAAYEAVGVRLVKSFAAGVKDADILLRVNKPSLAEIKKMPKGLLCVSFLDPFNEQPLIDAFAKAGVNAISVEMIPRTTLAQKMDALSSQANLSGYYAVIKAAERSKRILPMMMTPAGTITPAQVFVIGVGVAGLQAIATAKRLGARVYAFDTRPVVEEQVKSLGAKFVKINLGETAETKQGYAKALTAEQLEVQRKGLGKICAQSDIVITTAKLFGRRAPIVITKVMLDQMSNGSIVVDLAVDSGGNVEGCVGEEMVTDRGVCVLGFSNIETRVARHASQVYASNLASLIEHFWDSEAKCFQYNLEDEILKGCLITHNGKVIREL